MYSECYRAAIEAAHFSAYPSPLINLDDPEQVADSLARYVEKVNKDPNAFMERFLKPEEVPAAGEFNFSSVENNAGHIYYPAEEDAGWFMHYADISLFMGFRDTKGSQIYFAAGSFACGRGAGESTSVFPVIGKLQGADLRTYFRAANQEVKYAAAKDLMSRCKWEEAILSLILEWATEQQIHSVYLLQNNSRRYDPNRGPEYNETVKRMGFRLVQNGLYGIYLPPETGKT